MMHLPYPSDFSSVLARFEKESIVIKHKENFDITNLGAILFAKKLEDFEEAGRKRVRAIIYEDMSKLQTKLDILGVKGYAAGFQGLVEFVQTQTTINEVIEKAIRKPIKMYPEIAIRGLLPMRLFIKIFLKPECL
jgi:predicted HTH transcriptional regulator